MAVALSILDVYEKWVKIQMIMGEKYIKYI